MNSQLSLDETIYLMQKEIELEAMVFFRAYSHWALKRAFFFSLLRCQNYLNVSFKIKGMREDISIRWGNGANFPYSIVRIFFATIRNELHRHPFIRHTKFKKPDSVFYRKGLPKRVAANYSGNNNIWATLMGGGSLAGRPGLLLS